MTKGTELERVAPDDATLARGYTKSIATSATSIQPGQAVALSRHGKVLAKGAFDRSARLWTIGTLGALTAGAVLTTMGAWVAGPALYLAGMTPLLVYRLTGFRALMAVDVLAREGQLDEAQRRLDAADRARRWCPATYASLAGTFASHRGDYTNALMWWRRAAPKSKGIQREMLKLFIANALARNGELAEAKLVAQTASFPAGADEVLTGQVHTKIVLALHGPDADLPDVEQLHDWTRVLLAYSHTGVDLAAVGWAFERKGDADMAAFCAREAVERMHYKYLRTWWPELQQWLDARAD